MSNYNLTLFELIERVTLTDDQAEMIFATLTEQLDSTAQLHSVINAVRVGDARAVNQLALLITANDADHLPPLLAGWVTDPALDNRLRLSFNGLRCELNLHLRPTQATLRALVAYLDVAEDTLAQCSCCCDIADLRRHHADGDYARLPAFTAETVYTDTRFAPTTSRRTHFEPDDTAAVYRYYNEDCLVACARLDDSDWGNPVSADVPLWQIRERAKLTQGAYEPLPESVADRLEGLADHEVPHLSFKDKGMIAFTENARKGWFNIQSVARPGKYLRRHIKVTDQDLKELVAEVSSAGFMEIKFATTAEDIRDVYLNGPQSCMKYGRDTFHETVGEDGEWHHPCEVYGDPENDIELAYVEDAKGQIGARALINTDNRQYPAIYGSDFLPGARHVLQDWLDANGYEEDDDALRGQQLLRIDLRRGRILCPYIDRSNIGVEIYSDHLIAGGKHEAPHDKGYLFDEDAKSCDECGDYVDEDSLTRVDGDDEVCDSCLDSDFVRAVNRYGDIEWMRDGDVTRLPHDVYHDHEHVDYVADDFDDWAEIGLCRLDNGALVDEDEAVETSDEEWIDRAVTIAEDDDPTHVGSYITHVIIDDVAYPLGDCFWHENEDCWCLCEDHDLTQLDATGAHSYADPEQESLDSAA